jgi:hypothetical protein
LNGLLREQPQIEVISQAGAPGAAQEILSGILYDLLQPVLAVRAAGRDTGGPRGQQLMADRALHDTAVKQQVRVSWQPLSGVCGTFVSTGNAGRLKGRD